MARFAQALQTHRVPRRLGDVALRFDSPILIGRAELRPVGWKEIGLWCLAGALSAAFVAAVVRRVEADELAGIGVLAAAGLAAAGWLEQRRRLARRFVLNFDAQVLRLDFSTPIAGAPRSWVVDFAQVRQVDLARQADGRLAVWVEVEWEGRTYQEALVADVPEGERAGAAWFVALVRDACLQEPGAAPAPEGEGDRFEA